MMDAQTSSSRYRWPALASALALMLAVLPGRPALAVTPGSDGSYPNPEEAVTSTTESTTDVFEPAIQITAAVSPASVAGPTVVRQALAGPGGSVLPRVLILADTSGSGTPALVGALTAAGYVVTVFAPEYNWSGAPALSGFDCVIHLDGSTYWQPLAVPAQSLLTDWVRGGGCYIGTQWLGYERRNGAQPGLDDLVLQTHPGYQAPGLVTLTAAPGQAGHPLLSGIPNPVTLDVDWLSTGPQVVFATDPSTVIVQGPGGGPAVLVRRFGGGTVVGFAFALNYSGSAALNDPMTQRFLVNAVAWGASSVMARATNVGSVATRVYFDFSVANPDPATTGYRVYYGSQLDVSNANSAGHFDLPASARSGYIEQSWGLQGIEYVYFRIYPILAGGALGLPSGPAFMRFAELSGAGGTTGVGGDAGPGKDERCFIATAAHGTADASPVVWLRKFRDLYLLPTAPGRWFVETYYRLSPPVADFISDRAWARGTARVVLLPAVALSWLLVEAPPLARLGVLAGLAAGVALIARTIVRARRRAEA
jgi:hypothetical protein